MVLGQSTTHTVEEHMTVYGEGLPNVPTEATEDGTVQNAEYVGTHDMDDDAQPGDIDATHGAEATDHDPVI